MNWTEYLPLAEKTLSHQFNCQESQDQRILHAIIGCLTEVEEILDNYDGDVLLNDINKQGSIAEESADIFWYLSILSRELNIEEIEDKNFEYNEFKTLLAFTKATLKLLDLYKKKIYYNKPIDLTVVKILSIEMIQLLRHFCFLHGADVSKILDKNIEKLKARYGDKFSSEKAINRDLEKEREILEK
jgi:NTP pyrophosphatase (non-canonical NTP hydrolase)